MMRLRSAAAAVGLTTGLVTLCFATSANASQTGQASMSAAGSPHAVVGDTSPSDQTRAALASLVADGIVSPREVQALGPAPSSRAVAAVVSSAIDRVDMHPELATRSDVATLRLLIEALKDELDALDGRIDHLENRLDSREKRQRFGDRFSLRGSASIDVGADWFDQPPQGSEAGGAVPNLDPLTGLYRATDATNEPQTGFLSPHSVHSTISLLPVYHASDTVAIAAPVDLVDDPFGTTDIAGNRYRVDPALALEIRRGPVNRARLGVLDDLPSSLAGLTFRAPENHRTIDEYFSPAPLFHGAEVGGTVFGLTDYSVAVARVSTPTINTERNLVQLGDVADNGYFAPVPPPESGSPVSSGGTLQRYLINARVSQALIGYPGARLGFTLNRIVDEFHAGDRTIADATQNSGLVGDTVFGIDARLPIAAQALRNAVPVFYTEIASSDYTPDTRSQAPRRDGAAIVGFQAHVQKIAIDVHAQAVGPAFIDGAPPRYTAGPPAIIARNTLAYVPASFGFSNTVALNRRFDALLGNKTATAQDARLSFVYPVFNPFVQSSFDRGGSLFQAYVPNSRGITGSIAAPVTIGHAVVRTQTTYQHLEQVSPDAGATANFLATVPTNLRLRYDAAAVTTSVVVPAFKKHITVNVGGSYDRLRRLDTTSLPYYPYNAQSQSIDAGAVAAAGANGTSESYQPNYVDMHRYGYGASAAVPVARDVKVGVGYSTQHYGGSYGTSTADSLSERKDAYTGSVTVALPKENASVSIVGRQTHSIDDTAPSANLTETRGDVLFSVKF